MIGFVHDAIVFLAGAGSAVAAILVTHLWLAVWLPALRDWLEGDTKEASHD